MAPDGPRWPPMAPDGPQWPPMAPLAGAPLGHVAVLPQLQDRRPRADRRVALRHGLHAVRLQQVPRHLWALRLGRRPGGAHVPGVDLWGRQVRGATLPRHLHGRRAQ
eukprot:4874700-Prymnesium_polylepis.1